MYMYAWLFVETRDNYVSIDMGTRSDPVIHLQFWAYESWDSLHPISMSPHCKLMSPKHYF